MDMPGKPPHAPIPEVLERLIGQADEGDIRALLALMAKLRDSSGGCPWDLEQNFKTIAPYTIEEAYEVSDAVARDDMTSLADELGDLLFQVVYHAQMADERGAFRFADVVAHILAKMIRRHPHVFGDADIRDAEAQTRNWETLKAEERANKSKAEAASVLDNVPLALPALMRAAKLQRRMARVGFDWPDVAGVFGKIKEEIGELEVELTGTQDKARIADEFGDVLFALTNLARTLDIDPEEALRATNAKVERRFRAIETGLRHKGLTPEQASLEDMEALWVAAKRDEP